jgi:hypothetical protein
LFERLKTVQARQHDVEDDRVPGLAQRAFDSVRATVRRADFVTHRLEIIPDQTAQLAVVIDDEYARFARRRRRSVVQFIV